MVQWYWFESWPILQNIEDCTSSIIGYYDLQLFEFFDA